MEKGRIPYESHLLSLRVRAREPSCNAHPGSHAEAGVNHIERVCVSKGVTAYISGKNSLNPGVLFKLLCSLLECIKNCPVHAAGTEGRSPYRQRWKLSS